MSDHADPVARDRERSLEIRAAVDVMFEALSHIQASMETTSEEKRVESYKRFKEALYDRFEYLLEKRQGEEGVPEGTGPAVGGDGTVLENATDPEEKDEQDTLEKLWPAIARRET